MSLRPYKCKLLVRPLPEAEKSAGGIIFVETRKTEKSPTRIGLVVRAGESKIEPFKPGDRILYTPDVMSPVEVDEAVSPEVYEKLVLIRDQDVLGVFE